MGQASTAQITGLYQKYLGRDPYSTETAQLNNWAKLGLSGAEQGIAGSEEATLYKNKAGATTTPDASNPLDPYVAKASGIMDPEYNNMISASQGAAEQTKATYDKLAEQQLAREPLVRQTYANLSKEFAASQTRETNVAARIGEQNIGNAQASISMSGAGIVQGALLAPITQQQNKLMADIGTIADKYNLKQETLTSEMNTSLQELYDKADQYKITGQTEYSKAMVDIAGIKIQQKKDVLDLANQFFGIDMETKKFAQQIANDERQYALELKKYNESIRQFNVSQGSSTSKAQQEKASKFKAVANKSTLSDAQRANGEVAMGYTFYDDSGSPITPAEYFAAKGGGSIDLDQMKSVLGHSDSPSDNTIAGAITSMQQSKWSDAQIGQQLQYDFPHLF